MKPMVFAFAIIAAVPLTMLGACSSDDSSQQDSGPQNKPDTGTDSTLPQDSGPQETSTNDAGVDAPNPCSTGITFDNSVVPGWPNNVPAP